MDIAEFWSQAHNGAFEMGLKNVQCSTVIVSSNYVPSMLG